MSRLTEFVRMPSHFTIPIALSRGLQAGRGAVIGLMLASAPLFAGVHYIRAGATGTGDGSSWTNAFPTFAAANSAGLIRGDTYYIAGGTYNESVYINTALSGTQWIYFKKANLVDNVADLGFLATYATTVATIQTTTNGGALDLDKGYISFDGVTGSGTTGHGIVLYNSSTAANSYPLLLENGTGPYSIKHCEMRGSGYSASAFPTVGIYYNTGSSAQKNLYVGNCWIHEVTTNGVLFLNMVGTSYTDYGFLFENNVVSETGGCLDPSNHGQGMQLGQSTELGFCIIRNNVFRNIAGSGMIVFLSSGSGANHHDIQIYNNVFHITDLATYGTLIPGVIWAESDRGTYTNVHLDRLLVANNTFYGLGSPSATGASGSVILEAPVSGNVLINNLWENCRITGAPIGFATQSNNGYFGNTLNPPTGTPKQVDGTVTAMPAAATQDFHIVASTYVIGKGRNYPAAINAFTTDITGLPRGGIWDIGAYQLLTTGDAAATNAKLTSP